MARVVKADIKELEQLGKDIIKAKFILLGRLAERGRTHLVAEIPYKTGNLKQGVGPPEIDNKAMRAVLTVSARSGATGARIAEVFNAKGERTKVVTLRPQPAYNYAKIVAEGNKRATLSPSHAKAFLIPISGRPDKGGYLMIGGQIYIVRRSRKGKKANPFDERAARKLETEMPRIATAVLEQFV